MINLTIDGKQIQAKEGKRILEAALENDIYIPNLCAIKDIELPFGACRLCFVEIEGRKGMVTSCTEPVKEGMVVRTITDEITKMRRAVLEFILARHPHECLTCHRRETCGPMDVCLKSVSVDYRCVICPKNKRCDLQKVVDYVGLESVDVPYQYRNLPIESDPLIARDYNLCILCGKCVRVCQEERGVGAIAFIDRGKDVMVGTLFGRSLEDAGCQFCGACVDVCPVGALTERKSRWIGIEDGKVRSTCSYCGIGCQMWLHHKNGKIVRVTGVENAEPNKGRLCVKGKFAYDYIYHPDRLTTPLIKDDGGHFREASWDEALDLITYKIATILSESGPESFAGVSCARDTNEASYNMQKLFRSVIKTNNIDHCART